jgi:hypothetical protein
MSYNFTGAHGFFRSALQRDTALDELEKIGGMRVRQVREPLRNNINVEQPGRAVLISPLSIYKQLQGLFNGAGQENALKGLRLGKRSGGGGRPTTAGEAR